MSDTKRKMAQALKELMAEKPLKRITIQDIVERSHMTRQSFYYHFQDIYEVLELICRYDLVDQIAYREEESFAHWMERLMEIVETNKWFYRKMLQDMDWERVAGYLKPAVEAQIRRLVSGMLTEQETRSLSGGRELLIDFLTVSGDFSTSSVTFPAGRFRRSRMPPVSGNCFKSARCSAPSAAIRLKIKMKYTLKTG